MKEIFKIVRRNLERASQKQRHYYNLRRRRWAPKINDHVLVRQHPLSKAIDNFAAKMAPKFKGPYIITGFISPVIVQLRAADNREQRTAHISELKPYCNNDNLFSILTSRSPKSETKRSGERMDAEQKKFEQSRERFRKNIEAQQAKIRRTIFLQDDDMPTTSRGGQRRERCQSNPWVRGQRPKAPIPTTTTQRTKPARHFRIAVDSSTRQCTPPTGSHILANDVITISDDDEIAPPSPPFTVITSASNDQVEKNLEGERTEVQTPRSLSWDDDCETYDDLHLHPEDLNDPIIQEFYRSFLGENDTTVDVRPPASPSPNPPSSSSSIDWESENFRPPTPPKRKGFGELEVADRQYQYLGMHCYERVCRVRILVPRRQTTQALTDVPPSNLCQPAEEDAAWQFGSPPRQHTHSVPATPGRGWMGKSMIDPTEPTAPLCNSPARLPSTITSDASLTFEQLPPEVQQDILQRVEVRTEKRPRFIHEVQGQQYRITIKRDGTINLTAVEKRT